MPAQRKGASAKHSGPGKDRELDRLLRFAARLKRAGKLKVVASPRAKRFVA